MTRSSTRRFTALTVGVISLALVLAGCATPDADETPENDDVNSLLPPAEGKTEYPVTLTTQAGEIVIEERPERVAAVGSSGMDAELIVALGGTPVFAIEPPLWVVEASPKPIEQTVEGGGDIPIEKIATSQADLILGTTLGLEDFFAQLSDIAPLLGTPLEEDQGSGWRSRLRILGEALDLQDKAEQAIATNEQFFEQAHTEYPELQGKTAAYLIYAGEGAGLQYRSFSGSNVEDFLDSLGFARNPAAESFVDDISVSPENLLSADAEYVILSNVGSVSESELSEVKGQPLWERLGAVQSGRWVQIGNTRSGYTFDGQEYEGNLASAMAYAGPLSQVWAAEIMLPILSSLTD